MSKKMALERAMRFLGARVWGHKQGTGTYELGRITWNPPTADQARSTSYTFHPVVSGDSWSHALEKLEAMAERGEIAE